MAGDIIYGRGYAVQVRLEHFSVAGEFAWLKRWMAWKPKGVMKRKFIEKARLQEVEQR
jgi:hypothetical protein